MKVNRFPIFLERAKNKHGEKYDYSKVNYVNAHTKICIICPIHGEFWQTPNTHLNGCGCPQCSLNQRMTTQTFIEKAKEIHGDKYDYSKVEYVNAKTKVCVICPIHGEFWVTPSNHLRERGCPRCKTRKFLKEKYIPKKQYSNRHSDKATFIQKAKEIHGDKYDYSKVNYINNKTKVCIICPIHGEFFIRPDNHLTGEGCKLCAKSKKSISRANTIQSFIDTAQKIHGKKYNYSKVNFKTQKDTVIITCPIHGDFEQKVQNHLSGKGCQLCNQSHLERDIILFLEKNKINYIYQYKPKWLVNEENSQLSLDIYIPSKNIAIECQGGQHYEPVNFFGGIERFKKQIQNDKTKKEKCELNGINLLYYTNLNIKNTFKSLETLKKILEL